MLRPIAGAALVSLVALASGCVVRVAEPPPPPPRRVYVPPPPPPPPPAPTYVEPAADVEVTANEAPPPLPEYDQPPMPDDGYLWTPGYWAWGGGGYYWVPGTWVQPPQVGVLWTPPYWGFVGGVYAFHAGYWGPHVGFYGGVNYGFGYVGVGFAGGRWDGGRFAYNRAVTNVTVTNVHVYNETVVNNVTVNRVSYNGGPNGVRAVPTERERMAVSEQHVMATPVQRQHFQEAARNPGLSARANGGHPAIAATTRPASFNGPGVVGAHGAGPNVPRGGPNAGAAPGNPNAVRNGAPSGNPNQARPGAPGQPRSSAPNGTPKAAQNYAKPPPKPQQRERKENPHDKERP